jgi:5-methylcytosine-specific restriction endonuclease McrA
MNDTVGKVCRVCGEFKEYSEYHARKKGSKDGYRNDCKSCRLSIEKERYWKDRDRRVSQQSKYNHDHKEIISSKARNKRKQFPELIRSQEKKRYLKHRRKRIDFQIEYQRKNPEKVAIVQAKRRAWKMNSPGSFSLEEWKNLCELYGNRCLACHEEKLLTIDHVIPLSRGGTNTIDNIQPLCRSCNCQKSTKSTDYRTGIGG